MKNADTRWEPATTADVGVPWEKWDSYIWNLVSTSKIEKGDV